MFDERITIGRAVMVWREGISCPDTKNISNSGMNEKLSIPRI